jgi:hypothetical protein
MASISIPGNDGQLVVTNLPVNKIERATVAAETMIAAGMANSDVLAKMSKYQSDDPVHGTDLYSQQAASIKTPAAVTKTVKAKAPKAVTTAAPKAKRAKGANNAKRARALEMFTEMTAQGLSQEKMLKAVQDELKITYANTYYYYSRVFKKA